MAMPRGRLTALALVVALAIPGACRSGDRVAMDRPDGEAADPPAGVVDSALPIPVLLDRFRATIPETLATLSGGASTAEDAARALVDALAAGDSGAVRALVVSRAEFAWLYFPHSKYTTPPYELGPELVWLTTSAANEKGAGRLLTRFGGRPLRFLGLDCPDPAVREGPNLITPGCVTHFAVADSAPRALRLFSSLLSRDGRYKFLSYANDL